MSSNETLSQHFATYRSDVLAYIRSRVDNPHLAEDLLQQTFLRLLQRANWTTVENPKAYLKTTARNVLADHYRLKNVSFNAAGVEYNEQLDADDTLEPGSLLESHQQLELLTGALESLSSTVRRSFILCRFFGHTHAEAGEMLGLSPRTVEKHVAKGLAACFTSVDDGVNCIKDAGYRKGELPVFGGPCKDRAGPAPQKGRLPA